MGKIYFHFKSLLPLHVFAIPEIRASIIITVVVVACFMANFTSWRSRIIELYEFFSERRIKIWKLAAASQIYLFFSQQLQHGIALTLNSSSGFYFYHRIFSSKLRNSIGQSISLGFIFLYLSTCGIWLPTKIRNVFVV